MTHPSGRIEVRVESGVGAHTDDATLAWVFDLPWWGRCGYGDDEATALADLRHRLKRSATAPGSGAAFEVVERITGDEQAFARDQLPATDAEREATLAVLADCRAETITLVESASPEELDHDDTERVLPPWAVWRTPRQLAWHLVNTESRYYLAALDVAPPELVDDLLTALRRSANHVREAVAALPADVVRQVGSEVWTTVKVLRRLAWHERDELTVLRTLLEQSRR